MTDTDIEQLRTQARRRLIGAVVLLAVGVVSFPLVFETEPRPIGVDTPMQRVQGPVTGTTGPAVAAEPQPPRPTETEVGPTAQAEAPRTEAAPAPTEPSATPVAAAPAAAMPAAVTASPRASPAPVTSAVAPARADPAAAAAAREQTQRTEAQRARALLEGRSAAVPAPATAPPAAAAAKAAAAEPVVAARFVVQVGAFTDKRALAEARSRVERLGLKTYTQVVNSPAGPRTRVRVGPFESRAEAEAASAKLRAAGLPGAVLTL